MKNGQASRESAEWKGQELEPYLTHSHMTQGVGALLIVWGFGERAT